MKFIDCVAVAQIFMLGVLTSCSNAPPIANNSSAPVVIVTSSSAQASSSHNSSLSHSDTLAHSNALVRSNAPSRANTSTLSSNAIKEILVQKISSKQTSSTAQTLSNGNELKKSTVIAPEVADKLISAANVSGIIKVLGKNGEIITSDNVIVTLIPADRNHHRITPNRIQAHKVQMVNKAYSQKLLSVKRDDAIMFINSDKIKHNVFSTSGENSFDLGTYGKDSENSVILKATGIAKVYCNIHPDMAIFISVSDFNYSAITDKEGNYSIGDLPAGTYMLTAWNIRGESKQTIIVDAGKTLHVNFVIDTAPYVPVPHKNKFGGAYKVKSALFNDEFY